MHRHSTIPFLAACAGVAAFSAMDALMKELALAIGVYNALFWRSVAGSAMAGAVFVALRAHRPTHAALRLHVLRSTIVALMAAAFFWGLVRVPLAEAIAITFVAPLIALYLARPLLGERIGRAAVIASLLGLAGVLAIVGGKLRLDQSDDDLLGLGALLFSALLYAWNLILQRQQAQLATPLEIAFFQNLFVMLWLAAPAPWLAVPLQGVHLPQVIGAAGLALAALGALSWAYARAEAQLLVTVEYTAFVWAALLGWLLFAETLSAATLAGTALIVAGCIVANYRKPGPPQHVEAGAL